ncbi:hypothetical protein CCMA1212_009446 [Trichoderma ghanense]|uniref:Uncharacterized protein n=1 Tax=Trichoderma ghanense TaxID=65468 RepID=A0ABY2GU41_9HYPO
MRAAEYLRRTSPAILRAEAHGGAQARHATVPPMYSGSHARSRAAQRQAAFGVAALLAGQAQPSWETKYRIPAAGRLLAIVRVPPLARRCKQTGRQGIQQPAEVPVTSASTSRSAAWTAIVPVSQLSLALERTGTYSTVRSLFSAAQPSAAAQLQLSAVGSARNVLSCAAPSRRKPRPIRF